MMEKTIDTEKEYSEQTYEENAEEVLDELTDDENAAVEEAAEMLEKDSEKTDGVFTAELKKPLMYNGKEYTKLTFDFNKLTGADAVNIEDEMAAKGNTIFMNEVASSVYLMTMAARACEEHIPYNALKNLGIVDFNRIKNKARLFLLGVAV